MSDTKEIRWIATNPYNHKVILKQETFDKHINNDHTGSDAAVRKSLEAQTKVVVESPRYIIEDANFTDRYQYVDILPMNTSGQENLRMFKVIVDTSCYPHEVVTWMPVRNKIPVGGGIVYDSTRGIIKKQQV
jgi:hypothetical protein